LESDGGYRINLLGKKNDVRAYFNSDTIELKSIVITQSETKSEISNIILNIEDSLNLDIGRKSSTIFDLR
jgi:hypothetical protein